MIDPRREAILTWSHDKATFQDKTSEILKYRLDGKFTYVTFSSNPGKVLRYRAANVLILGGAMQIPLGKGARVEVRGAVRRKASEVWRFDGIRGGWWRIISTTVAGESYETCPDLDVRITQNVAQDARAAGVLEYWRSVVANLRKSDDPLRRPYAGLNFVHPDSALGRYLKGDPVDVSDVVEPISTTEAPMIFPFSFNLSQREAVERTLYFPVSVIDGPPGTGKTQTILNLIANIIASPGKTVGVVSFSNAAVDNVRDKLEKHGFGYAVAGLGNRDKKEEFFKGQSVRNAEVDALVSGAEIAMPSPGRIADLDQRLRRLQESERSLARWREEVAAYRLELSHFSQFFERQELPLLGDLPILRQPSRNILDYLADAELAAAYDGPIERLIRRVRRYFKYGSMRGIDPADTAGVLRLQRAYYDKKIAELERQISDAEDALRRADFAGLTEEHSRLSVQALRAGLQQRYAASKRVEYAPKSRYGARFADDYPVVLSTCHSLRSNMADGYLLDYLIIDEASQVNLLAAGLALACARHVVVVGDLQQIQHIADTSAVAAGLAAPLPAYDYQRNNILSSLIELYGDTLPRTMLREHYRCHPAIIGFCNKKFYGGQLIPFTSREPGAQPLVVVRTTEGNHMRLHDGGGRSNQREVAAIVQEVLPGYCAEFSEDDIGIATPYRRQVDKLDAAGIGSSQADTVHQYQGREKGVLIMTTVLSENARGRSGLSFVDDPHLVNVAVSRAVKRFVLVTNHDLLPKSRNLRDLIGYIRYHDPDHGVVDSAIVSVFDLLYREYSARLRPLAGRLQKKMPYLSEDIIWTRLQEILAEEPYVDLTAVPHVLLHNLLLDLTRLTPEQTAFVKNRASVDFVVYNRITNRLACAIEVDGFAFHENNPVQLVRDAHKDAICAIHQIPLLRLPTTGSGEEQRIRQMLDSAMNDGV